MQASNGIQHVRTHVDVTDPTYCNGRYAELKEELKDFVNLQ